MKIESYSFGNVTVCGKSYTKDIIIFPDRIQERWWRKEGHSLCAEDLETALEAGPEILIVGCGAYGAMRIPDQTKQLLSSHGIDLISDKTSEAIRIYNEMDDITKVILCLHLTC